MSQHTFSNSLLGMHITNIRGNSYKIVAVWLPQDESTHYRTPRPYAPSPPRISCLGMGQYGETFIILLPDPDWALVTDKP